MESDTKSFIVRIWIESVKDGASPIWRGVVEQVGSSKRLYFQDLERAFQFVREQAGIGLKSISTPRGGSLPWWKRMLYRIRTTSQKLRQK